MIPTPPRWKLARKPNTYRAVVVSLSSLYKEELTLIGTLRRRFPQSEVWLTHTDGRQGALAEAMRMGADGLLADDGLHRIGVSPTGPIETPVRAAPVAPLPTSSSTNESRESEEDHDDMEFLPGEPVLTADELRALLQEQPSLPPGDE
jgi:hypothetical protein